MNEIHHPDGRVELRDTSRIERSPLYNHDLAPVPLAGAHVVHLQLRGAVDQHGALHPDLHAGVGVDGERHELVAGARHHPPRQHHRPHSHPAQLASRHQVRHPVSRFRARRLRHDRFQPARADARARGLRLVRHPGVDRRRSAADVLRGHHPRLAASRSAAGSPDTRRPNGCRSCSSGASTSSSSTAGWISCARSRTGRRRSSS